MYDLGCYASLEGDCTCICDQITPSTLARQGERLLEPHGARVVCVTVFRECWGAVGGGFAGGEYEREREGPEEMEEAGEEGE